VTVYEGFEMILNSLKKFEGPRRFLAIILLYALFNFQLGCLGESATSNAPLSANPTTTTTLPADPDPGPGGDTGGNDPALPEASFSDVEDESFLSEHPDWSNFYGGGGGGDDN
jgi:hypothetical protein